MAVVAPFFFLKLDGILDEKPARSGALDAASFFANNYTVQDVKIKSCKALLNRTYCYLSLLDRPMLANALTRENIPHISFKYAENSGQMQPIREQAGTFADSIKLWSGVEA